MGRRGFRFLRNFNCLTGRLAGPHDRVPSVLIRPSSFGVFPTMLRNRLLQAPCLPIPARKSDRRSMIDVGQYW
jgi:hypothetical protein